LLLPATLAGVSAGSGPTMTRCRTARIAVRLRAATRPSPSTHAQESARRKGARIDDSAELDAVIIFAPAGELVPAALRRVVKGGTVVCAGIHMSDIPSFPYSLLWGERVVRSVANLTRDDGVAFFDRLKTLRIETERTRYPLEQANEALAALRSGEWVGTAVLT